MKRWLLKTEPSEFSFDDLVRDGRAIWDGIANALALQNLRQFAPDDELIIYHTGSERRAVGLARVRRGPFADPGRNDPKLAVVEIEPLRALTRPVTLDQIKADPVFARWDLLKISRLSVVPIPDPVWRRLMKLAGRPAKDGSGGFTPR